MYRILVVDNDSTSLAIVKGILGGQYKVNPVKSGLQMLGYLKGNVKPDVILLDMSLPDAKGIEVLDNLKKDPNLSGIPVLFMTGAVDDDFRVEVLRRGAEDYIQKPVNPELLRMRIKKILDAGALRRENAALRSKLQDIRQYVESACAQ